MSKSEHHAINPPHNPLWTYSIKQYSIPGIETFLLDAQDNHNLNINILLFIAWLAGQQHILNAEQVFGHDQFCQLINQTQRIRTLRRVTKKYHNAPFYNALKQLELRIEKLTIELLLSKFGQMSHNFEGGFEDLVGQSLVAYFTYQRKPVCESWLKEFIQLFKP